MEQRLTVVTLGVADLERSGRFYGQALGWKRSSQSQDGVIFFALGGWVLSLFGRNDLVKDAHVSPEEVDAVLAQASQHGGRLVKAGEKVFRGRYSGYFADPDGHLEQMAVSPFWPLDERGQVDLG
ncbi:MAG: VOC family protein [Dehalococcoidia bacterium]|nr:VOC family protein [Dehalococcoidia bacterium]